MIDQKIFEAVEAVAPDWAAIFEDFEHLRDHDLFRETAGQLLASAPSAQARELVHQAQESRLAYLALIAKYEQEESNENL